MKCDWEQPVIEATRNGLWASSLRAHLRHCALCSQIELIAASLQQDAARAERLFDLPPAGMVWRRAQDRRRERALGAVYSVVLLLWGMFQIPQSVYRLFIAPPGLTEHVALTGAVLSGILAIAGSCVLVLETKR
jgi:hypothetical protein